MQSLPSISTRFLEPIINKIHYRYPILSKPEIVLIVNSLFEIIRNNLILGKTISLNGFISRMKLIFYSRIENNKIYKYSIVKITTPKKIKQHER